MINFIFIGFFSDLFPIELWQRVDKNRKMFSDKIHVESHHAQGLKTIITIVIFFDNRSAEVLSGNDRDR